MYLLRRTADGVGGYLQQQRIAGLLLNGRLHALRVCYQQVVAHHLRAHIALLITRSLTTVFVTDLQAAFLSILFLSSYLQRRQALWACEYAVQCSAFRNVTPTEDSH